jgi:hypothetical protein
MKIAPKTLIDAIAILGEKIVRRNRRATIFARAISVSGIH